MIINTVNIQFLIVGTTRSGVAFEDRLNFKFWASATPADIAQKRRDLEKRYTAKGCKVSVYTVSPHLQIPIA
jgi:hypothetical protein